ncbi:MAG: hypothetical protein L7T19_06000 [Pseudomonadales bacterium]|nr:hypothetical protein [Pseudomonadales bacterium]
MKSKTILVLDTETVGLEGHVYDVGYTITNKRGEILAERTWLVEENFTNPKKMMGAFYAGKHFTHYARMLQDGEIRLTAWADIVAALRADMAAFSVDIIAAYNAGFDFRVIAQTHADLGFSGAIIESPVQVLDIWQFACETKLQQKQYANIARALGWVSPAGNIKTGAEFAYRFVCGDHSFIEDHTALSDALIETAILAECYRQKKAVPYGKINGAPWRLVNPKAGNDDNIHGSKVA